MVILLDLNRPLETVDDTLWSDAPLDTVMIRVATRAGALTRDDVIATDDPPDDDAFITWEDAEWQ